MIEGAPCGTIIHVMGVPGIRISVAAVLAGLLTATPVAASPNPRDAPPAATAPIPTAPPPVPRPAPGPEPAPLRGPTPSIVAPGVEQLEQALADTPVTPADRTRRVRLALALSRAYQESYGRTATPIDAALALAVLDSVAFQHGALLGEGPQTEAEARDLQDEATAFRDAIGAGTARRVSHGLRRIQLRDELVADRKLRWRYRHGRNMVIGGACLAPIGTILMLYGATLGEVPPFFFPLGVTAITSGAVLIPVGAGLLGHAIARAQERARMRGPWRVPPPAPSRRRARDRRTPRVP